MDSEFWLDRWQSQRIGFHRQELNPHLLAWWSELNLAPQSRIAVPLCGKSVDLHWLAERHPTTGIEWAAPAVDAFWSENQQMPIHDTIGPFKRSRLGQLMVLCGDFFALSSEHIHRFHGWYDRASFIALPPELRPRYVETLRRILEPGARGLMVTIEYKSSTAQGPPFSISPSMVAETLGDGFSIRPIAEQSMDAVGGLRDRGVQSLTEHIIEIIYSPKASAKE